MKKEYDFSKMKEVKNPYAGKKKAVGINLSPEVIDYFKKIAEDNKQLPDRNGMEIREWIETRKPESTIPSGD